MAKLYFRYGAVSSAKTMNLVAVAHNYRQQGKEISILKPELDTRFGKATVRSRAGLEMAADVLVNEASDLLSMDFEGLSCILVDEAQFMSPKHIDQLRHISLTKGIPVICYGLRTDFRSKAFPGSLRLLEIADSIEEVKTTCTYCNKKATMSLKHVNDKATLAGPSVELGSEEKYYPTCFRCYHDKLQEANADIDLVNLAAIK